MDPRALSEVELIEEDIERYLERVARIFTAFRSQDSGNLSYGVECSGRRFFVKTPGPDFYDGRLIYDFPSGERYSSVAEFARDWRGARQPT